MPLTERVSSDEAQSQGPQALSSVPAPMSSLKVPLSRGLEGPLPSPREPCELILTPAQVPRSPHPSPSPFGVHTARPATQKCRGRGHSRSAPPASHPTPAQARARLAGAGLQPRRSRMGTRERRHGGSRVRGTRDDSGTSVLPPPTGASPLHPGGPPQAQGLAATPPVRLSAGHRGRQLGPRRGTWELRPRERQGARAGAARRERGPRGGLRTAAPLCSSVMVPWGAVSLTRACLRAEKRGGGPAPAGGRGWVPLCRPGGGGPPDARGRAAPRPSRGRGGAPVGPTSAQGAGTVPASPRSAFSTATPRSSSCLCFSSTCSSCLWMIWGHRHRRPPFSRGSCSEAGPQRSGRARTRGNLWDGSQHCAGRA